MPTTDDFAIESPSDDVSRIPDGATQVWLDHQKRRHRDGFAKLATWVTYIWVGFLIAITIIQFFGKVTGIRLQPEEFIAVVTSTTVSVLGFGVLWGKNIYLPGRDSRN